MLGSPTAARPRLRLSLCALAVLLGIAAIVAIAGCGGGSSSGNGVSSKSADEILVATKAAASAASSVHVTGTLASHGTPITLDMSLAAGKGGKGKLSENGLSFELIVVDETIYIKGSPSFYDHFGGSSAAQLFQGKWLKAPADKGELASLASLANLGKILDQSLASTGSLTKGSTSTVNGQPVIELTDSTKSGSLFVATTGDPYPVQIRKHGAETGQVSFSDWNQPVDLTAPANAIDIGQLGK
ncbi:MAG TPA: hypothetical protein VL972_02555 [Solirubrobacteraceae bacterium]|nr:hypothetical protein [Solirubrobacteraceae bacterium]